MRIAGLEKHGKRFSTEDIWMGVRDAKEKARKLLCKNLVRGFTEVVPMHIVLTCLESFCHSLIR